MRVWTDQRQTFWLYFQLSSGLSKSVEGPQERTAAGLLMLETIIFFKYIYLLQKHSFKKLVKKKKKERERDY